MPRYPLFRAVIAGGFRFGRKPYAVQAKNVESNLVRTLLPQRFSPELDNLAQRFIFAEKFARSGHASWGVACASGMIVTDPCSALPSPSIGLLALMPEEVGGGLLDARAGAARPSAT